MIESKTINMILLARRLYDLACENLKSELDLSLSIGVNLLQDAVESFLLAVAGHIQADVGGKTNFDQYFDAIQKKTGCDLPLRLRLTALNKLRVNSKHYGLAPAKSETTDLPIIVKLFFEEVCTSLLDCSFTSISLIDLMSNGEPQELLKQAQLQFENGKFEECLISCRKAVFIRIESLYDIFPFAKGETANGLLSATNKSPYYARGPQFVEKYIKDPTDFIVFDYNQLELEFIKTGIDSHSFWNIWRLTPEVYRYGRTDSWIVKREFNKLDEDGIKERTEYVLDATINLFVAADQKQSLSKSASSRDFFINLTADEIPIYEKTDKNSKVLDITAKGLFKLFVTYAVQGLDNNGTYWKVSHYEDGKSYWGYIADEFVQK